MYGKELTSGTGTPSGAFASSSSLLGLFATFLALGTIRPVAPTRCTA